MGLFVKGVFFLMLQLQRRLGIQALYFAARLTISAG